jgi:hypothetical protein
MGISSSCDFRSRGTRNRWERINGCSTTTFPPLLTPQRIFSRRVVSGGGPLQDARDPKKPGMEVLTTVE